MSKTVLVLDDDPTILELFQAALEEEGYSVIICPDPNSAIKAFQKQTINIALIDLALPGMKGKEVIVECKTLQKHCLFFVISGRLTMEEFIQLQTLGVIDCFRKPSDVSMIIKAISMASK